MMMSCALLVQGNQEIAPFMAPVWEENTEDFQLRQLGGEPNANENAGAPNANENAGATTTTDTVTPAPQPAAGQETQQTQAEQRTTDQPAAADQPAAPAQEAEKPKDEKEKKEGAAWALSAIFPLMMTMLQW